MPMRAANARCPYAKPVCWHTIFRHASRQFFDEAIYLEHGGVIKNGKTNWQTSGYVV